MCAPVLVFLVQRADMDELARALSKRAAKLAERESGLTEGSLKTYDDSHGTDDEQIPVASASILRRPSQNGRDGSNSPPDPLPRPPSFRSVPTAPVAPVAPRTPSSLSRGSLSKPGSFTAPNGISFETGAAPPPPPGLPAPVPPPRKSGLVAVVAPLPASEIPGWVAAVGQTVADDWVAAVGVRRFAVDPPGTLANPLHFRDEVFTDLIFELGATHILFERCRFVRAPVEGPSRQVTYVDCDFADASSSKTPTRVKAMGGADNRLVFTERSVVCTSLDMGDVHVLFDRCTFHASDLFCGVNVAVLNTSFSPAVDDWCSTRPLAFGVVLGSRVLYGQVRVEELPPPVPAPHVRPSIKVRGQSFASRMWRQLSAQWKREAAEERKLVVVGSPTNAATVRPPPIIVRDGDHNV